MQTCNVDMQAYMHGLTLPLSRGFEPSVGRPVLQAVRAHHLSACAAERHHAPAAGETRTSLLLSPLVFPFLTVRVQHATMFRALVDYHVKEGLNIDRLLHWIKVGLQPQFDDNDDNQ